MSQDVAVMETNSDATSCKAYAVSKGYWKDPFICYFSGRGSTRPPEISRGYYARVRIIYEYVLKFLKLTHGTGQIVNLGAGFDTLYWRLQEDSVSFLKVVELDFKEVVSSKGNVISRNSFLQKHLTDFTTDDATKDLYSRSYACVSANLHDLSSCSSAFRRCGFDYTAPTLYIAECVLIYLEADASFRLCQWIAENHHEGAVSILSYEQVNVGNRFGAVMVENLKQRGCDLPGLPHCQSLETQKSRFLRAGFSEADARTMLDCYRLLPSFDVARVERLEFLDDTEILTQLFEQYCITTAYIDNMNLGLSDIVFSCQ